MKKMMICNKCGWAHFPTTRFEVEEQASSFGEYIKNEKPETQKMFGFGPLSKEKKEWSFESHVKQSEKCFRCGNSYENFREENETDKIPMGCTLQGIIKV
jgi:protein-arginine kinase activator protein McsA